MSEAERKRRFDYKHNRSKWIRVWAFIIAIVSIATVLLTWTYYNTSKNYYINYTENSEVDYKVYLKENDFYDEEYLDKDQAYIASLIDKVSAKLRYELNMEEAVNYSYTYKVNARLEIVDKSTGLSLYHPTFELVPEKAATLDNASKKLILNETVKIDYDEYNDMAKNFVEIYSLTDVLCSVVVEMKIEVISACESFQGENSKNNYYVSLHVPLNKQKIDIEMVSTVPTEETKILACTDNKMKSVYMGLSIAGASIDVILIALLIAFIFLTRNTDINYSIKVNKILSAYKSYIQQIVSPFDSTGYQVLLMQNFTEMLEIRDTIQSPILMNENEDKTCTRFFIPTNTNLLYVYEIKVDDYDEIYNTAEIDPIITDEIPELEPVVEEDGMEEETVILVENMENIDEEALAEAIAAPSIPLAKIDYDEDDDEDEEEGVEIIGVVWPERPTHNKVYRYDPNGEKVTNGDIVLVPSRDAAQNRNIIRKATVAHGNHKIDPEHLNHPLKKIIGIVKRKTEQALMPKEEAAENKAESEEPALK